MSILKNSRRLFPGVILSAAVAGLALAMEHAEFMVFHVRWVESIVLAIAIGIFIATWRPIEARFRPGIEFSAKGLLEAAIVLIGASISYSAIRDAGVELVVGVASIVFLSIAATYLIGRLLGLSAKLAILIACGNSIWGNSAIVAVAPVIEAPAKDVAAALAFTAGLGILAIFLLPLLYYHLELTLAQYGVVAGITAYAVPQVLAATAPVGAVSVQIGTLVKLIRVLMLGPVVFALNSAMKVRVGGQKGEATRPLVPWFILGFFGMVALRSSGLVSTAQAEILAQIASILTTLAMAALGLSVNVRSFFHAGGRVMLAATCSVVLLALMGFVLVSFLVPLP
ncbi:YeiH family protein [Chelativorans oligotrophicus]|uniref:YeiH family protein n=1 Tax=Chelativorans oligotrophicus TaxID=449974 RepID=UPI00140A5FCE|nr:putative sulfate exporter family transporter [Chelativorans oligotrophicus]